MKVPIEIKGGNLWADTVFANAEDTSKSLQHLDKVKSPILYLYFILWKLYFSYVCSHICVSVTYIIYASEHTQRPEKLSWGHIIASSETLQE